MRELARGGGTPGPAGLALGMTSEDPEISAVRALEQRDAERLALPSDSYCEDAASCRSKRCSSSPPPGSCCSRAGARRPPGDASVTPGRVGGITLPWKVDSMRWNDPEKSWFFELAPEVEHRVE